jgi:hypothetical protein
VSPGEEKKYALDFVSVVRHVATAMEGVAPAALSIGEMAATYVHVIPGDLTRVKHHHGLETNDEAIRFLVERAVQTLGKQAESDGNGGFRLTRPFDELRYKRKKLARAHDPHAQLRDPFNPMSGAFSDNVRKVGDLDELRESMRAFGWIEHLPAVEDERGVVLMGHRRLAVAAELGIDPVVKTIRFGSGDEADARRLKLALASNIGAKPFTPSDRKRIAEYLYAEREWVMVRIAEALNVNQSTVTRDLMHVHKSRPGRPRNITPEQEQVIVDESRAFGGTKTLDQLADDLGLQSIMSVRRVVDQELGRRDVLEGRTCVCPRCEFHHPPNGASA